MKFILLLSLPLFILSQELQTRTQVLMGTFVHITLPIQNNRQISESFTQLHAIEEALSSYEPHLVYRLNHTHTVPYNTTLAKTLELSRKYYADTYGYFDITIGSVSKILYHFGEENATLPSNEALQHAKFNIDAINITEHNISTQEGIALDLGGMGKGFGVDAVVKQLEEQNITQGIIALSGDIRCLDVCTFALQSPYSEQTFAALKSKIPQLSISTSGTYRRYVGTKDKHHLINPKTAKQGKAFVSVSLFTQADNSKIDAYATAISVMSLETALIFLKEHDDIGFVLVKSDGKIIYGNLEKLVELQWLDYKEKATIDSINKKSNTNKVMENNLIHPDTISPKMIAK